ncbi:MAG TPA: hypothetical protein VIL85_20255 [Thermomicrobiales bacterium]
MAMTDEDHTLTEAALRYVLVGLRFCRAHFYGHPILYVEGPRPAERDWDGDDASILVGTRRWRIHETLPTDWQEGVASVAEQPIEDLVRAACMLRHTAIVEVRLGRPSPHLLLVFDDGRVLVLNGHHDLYEQWELMAGHEIGVIAVPGDNIAYWLPEEFTYT